MTTAPDHARQRTRTRSRCRVRWFASTVCLAALTSTHLFSAENGSSPGSFDQSFASPIHHGEVVTILAQPDGRLLVGGSFLVAGVATNLGRFTQDGVPDPTFNTTSRPWKVTRLAVQPNGNVIVGHKGGVQGGSPSVGLSRFLPDGSKDPSFQFRLPTNSINNGIWSGFWTTALTVQPDGKILLAGRFERDHFDYVYWSAVSLRRLLADGSEDAFFNFAWPAPQEIDVLLLLPDQSLLVAGDQLARLNPDGTEDSGFARTVLSSGRISCCITQANGKILVGGSFTDIQGQARCRVARILPDGQLDLSFNPPVSAREGDPNYTEVCALAIQVDGRILVGGNFETIDGLPYAALARLNSDGSLDTSFPPIIRRDEEEDAVTANAIVMQDGERAIIGGANMVTPDGSDAGDLFRIHLVSAPSPRLSILHVPGGTIELSFLNPGGYDFTVLRSTNLNLPAVDWTVLGPATNSGGNLYRFTDQLFPAITPQFYQLRRSGPR